MRKVHRTIRAEKMRKLAKFGRVILVLSLFAVAFLMMTVTNIPSAVAATANFGHETIETTYANPEDAVRGSDFIVAYSGTLDSITAYLVVSGGYNDNVKVAIYRDNDNVLLGESAKQQISVTGWYTFNMNNEPLTAGENYILVAWAKSATGTINLSYTTGDTNQGHAKVSTFDGFPSPLVGATLSTRKHTIYGTMSIPVAPSKPVLVSPENNYSTTDNTPTFTWTAGSNATSHRLVIDNSPNFNDGENIYDNKNLGGSATTCTIENELPVGNYWWKVCATNAQGDNWSENTWTFEITEVVHEWQIVETWTGTTTASASWKEIESWTGIINTVVAWIQIVLWAGTIYAPASWKETDSWEGTVNTIVSWQSVEEWTGFVNSPANWSEVETWSGTANAPVGWKEIEAWIGTINAAAVWSLITVWTGIIYAPAFWNKVDEWNGVVEAPAYWRLAEEWTGTTSAPANWILVEEWSGTIATEANWNVVDEWQGTIQTFAGWSTIETWLGTIYAPAGWVAIDTWAGSINSPANWVSIETWSGTIQVQVYWVLMDYWTGSISSPAGWLIVETWSATVSAPRVWKVIEIWSGHVLAPVWGVLESWNAIVNAPVQWGVLETWNGILNTPDIWTIYTPVGPDTAPPITLITITDNITALTDLENVAATLNIDNRFLSIENYPKIVYVGSISENENMMVTWLLVTPLVENTYTFSVTWEGNFDGYSKSETSDNATIIVAPVADHSGAAIAMATFVACIATVILALGLGSKEEEEEESEATPFLVG